MAYGMMHLLLGVRKESDGVRMLRLILARYGIYEGYRMDFCYQETPPSKAKDRVDLLMAARTRLEGVWLQQPGTIVGLGWMPCELLTGKGKTKLKDKVGTKWSYVNNACTAWITYDPDACLFDPALVVEIAAVLVAAGREAGISMRVSKNEALQQMNNIWKRYL
jgi:hypothetical protein